MNLQSLRTPALILQGTRDQFGTESEVPAYDLSKAIRIEWLPDGDHSFAVRLKVTGKKPDAVLTEIFDAVSGFVREAGP